ncbi:MAG: 2-phospho-L-lactate guanylyltransferase [Actinomycetota bacterium]|nr:2-phospho-L-lactate guanylyltransferase [Actinomycetota bacterium]
MDAGLIPIKPLDQSKRRLLNEVSESERAEIAEALVEDALGLCDSVDVLRWWVVTSDEAVVRMASSRDIGVVADPGDGLNEALLTAIGEISSAGAESVIIVPVDVPLAFKGDIEDLLDTGATSDVVVVPAEGDGGTNALYLSPPHVMDPSFGRASFRAHLAEAERRSLRCSILNLPRLALDLDTIEDAHEILKRTRFPTTTSRALERILGTNREA